MEKELAMKIANAVGEICLAYKGSKPGITPAGTKVDLADILGSITFDANGNISVSDKPSLSEKDVENIVSSKLLELNNSINNKIIKFGEDLKRTADNMNITSKAVSDINDKLHETIARVDDVENVSISKEAVKRVVEELSEENEATPIEVLIQEAVESQLKNIKTSDDENLTVRIFKGEEIDDAGVKHTYSRAKMPFSKHPDTNSGYDGYVCWDDDTDSEQFVGIAPGTVVQVPIGISAVIPKGYEIQLRPRSGASKDGHISVFGTIDETYRGVIKANVANISSEPLVVNEGDRICQFVLAKVTHAKWVMEEGKIDTNTDRGTDGFGSSGKR